MKEHVIKRNIKDTVFTFLFKHKKYCLELFKAFNPYEEATEDDIEIVTLKPILLNGIYNDLGILVKNKIVLLAEAQSTWSEIIVWRIFGYLANSYNKYFIANKISLYNSKHKDFPKPELFVIYTGDRKITKEEISLNETYFNGKGPIDVRVRIITRDNVKKLLIKNNIISQYIDFTYVSNENVKKYGRTKEILERVIDECVERNIVKKFMKENRKELIGIMDVLYNDDIIMESYEHEIREEGREKGREEGMINILVRQFKDKKISANEGANYLGVTVEKFLELVK